MFAAAAAAAVASRQPPTHIYAPAAALTVPLRYLHSHTRAELETQLVVARRRRPSSPAVVAGEQ